MLDCDKQLRHYHRMKSNWKHFHLLTSILYFIIYITNTLPALQRNIVTLIQEFMCSNKIFHVNFRKNLLTATHRSKVPCWQCSHANFVTNNRIQNLIIILKITCFQFIVFKYIITLYIQLGFE